MKPIITISHFVTFLNGKSLIVEIEEYPNSYIVHLVDEYNHLLYSVTFKKCSNNSISSMIYTMRCIAVQLNFI